MARSTKPAAHAQGSLRRRRAAKVVATLGPASSSPEIIAALFHAGVDVFRLNFSHGTQDDHRQRPEAIRALREEGLRLVMLTGDNRTTAEAVARRLGIEEVEADVLPDRKAAVVERLQKEGRTVAMAGDGVNDAPALARADVGVAMGSDTDVAMESAGVTLVGGDLRGLVRARRLSRATMRNICENLLLALGVANILAGVLRATPVGAGYSGTTANEAAGAQSRLAGLAAAAVAVVTAAVAAVPAVAASVFTRIRFARHPGCKARATSAVSSRTRGRVTCRKKSLLLAKGGE